MNSREGGVAQMVERSLSMREVPGSIPGISKLLYPFFKWRMSFFDHVSSVVVILFKLKDNCNIKIWRCRVSIPVPLAC